MKTMRWMVLAAAVCAAGAVGSQGTTTFLTGPLDCGLSGATCDLTSEVQVGTASLKGCDTTEGHNVAVGANGAFACSEGVTGIVAADVKAFARTGQAGPTLDDLAPAAQTGTKGALQASSLAYDAGDQRLTGQDAEGNPIDVSLLRTEDGVSVQDEGTTRGGFRAVRTLNFVGAAVQATVAGEVASVHVTGGTAPARTDGEIDGLIDARVADLRAFDAAMRETETLAGSPFQWTQNTSNAAHDSGIALPGDTNDRRLVLTFTNRGTGTTAAGHTVDLGVVRSHRVTRSQQLDGTNSVAFTAVGATFRFGLLGNHLGVAADTAGDWQVAVVEDQIDLRPEARLSNAGRWGKDKVPADTVYTGDLPAAPAPWAVAGMPEPGGDAHTLEVQAALPAVAGYSVGDVINVSGTLYELVGDGSEGNTWTGPIGPVGTMYGQARFNWGVTDPQNIRAYLPNPLPGGVAPPNDLWLRVVLSSGETQSVLRMSRAPADDRNAQDPDVPNTYAYHKAAGEPGLEGTTGTYKVSFFTDEAQTAALNVHAAGHRWEILDRGNTGALPERASTSLSDMPGAAQQTAANDGKFLQWDNANGRYALGPGIAIVTSLPAQQVAGVLYFVRQP